MRRFGRKSRSAIGLDLGARYVTAVQLERAGGGAAGGGAPAGWRVAAAARVSRGRAGQPFDAAEASRLCDTIDRLGFTGTDVVLAAPQDKLLAGVLELPPRNAQIPLEQIARVELARTNKCPPESFEMGYWELPSPARAGRASHVMAVGYAHADAAALLDLVEGAGFSVVAIDARCCALARACGGLASPPPGLTAILDLGWSGASLVLLHDGVVVSERALAESGTDQLYDAFSTRLRLDPEMTDYLLGEVGLRDASSSSAAAAAAAPEALDARGGAVATAGEPRPALPDEARGALSAYADGLVRELLVSFSYATRQYTDATVARLLLAGAGAAVPGLGEFLSKELGLETVAVAPKDLAECPPPLLEACSSPELTPAAGLALFPET
jgi:Tfp pilus assembly PilM family ATPase